MMKGSWWSRIAAVVGVVALLFAGSVAGATSAQAWDSGRGFTLFGNKDTKNRPSYTIRFSSARLQNAAKPLFERAVGELHSFANTRVRFAGVGPRTNAVDEIFVAEAGVRSCAGVAWGEWDGCTSIQRPGNVVSSAYMELRYDNLIGDKSEDYKKSMVSHELGHALGLDHSSDPGQLMHYFVDRTDFAGDKTYKSGDRAGLNYLARSTPTPPGTRTGLPVGQFDSLTSPEPGKLRVTGWAFDPDKKTAASQVHIYIGGPYGSSAVAASVALRADKSRPDVGKAHPGAGNNHGFDHTMGTNLTGNVPVYVYAINLSGTPGENRLLATKTVNVGNPNSPIGQFESLTSPTPGKLRVTGWTIDPNNKTAATQVHIYIGGPAGSSTVDQSVPLQANKPRPDVGKAHPGAGNNHGFDQLIETKLRGEVPVYAYAINLPDTPGGNHLLGKKTVDLGDPTSSNR